MKRIPFLLLALALIPAFPAMAQEHMHDENGEGQHQGGAVASIAQVYEVVKGHLTAAAEQMPEEFFGYRPVEEVRSFGEIVGHVANANFMICSRAGEMESTATGDYEKETSKAALVDAIKKSFEFCDAAYKMSDEKAMEEMQFFTGPATRLMVLAFNATHDYEHYGNLVTYMRSNGQVPPSSQGGM